MHINDTIRRVIWAAVRNLMALVLTVFFCYGCTNTAKEKTRMRSTVADTLLKGDFNAASKITFDSAAVDKFIKQRPVFKEFGKDLRRFYRLRQYHFVWYDSKGLIEPAHNLITQIDRQKDEGVFKEIPAQAEYAELISKNINTAGHQPPDITTELMLTAQYFNYAKNVWGGGSTDKPSSIGWYLPRKKLLYADLLKQNIVEKSMSDTVKAAVIPQYVALKQMLKKYQELGTQADEVIPSSDSLRKVRAGGTLRVLAIVRKRLNQLGDIDNDNKSAVYDEDLKNGVFSFKQRHGQTVNDIIDRAFLKQLNVPVKKRMEQIIVNLERMRWIPTDNHGDEFILINIPEFKLHYYEMDKIVWDCNVVVGKTMNKTEIFSGKLLYVIFSPYWNIPKSIIEKEIKPGMARNSNYLANHNMEWNGGKVRQKPGKTNSLGLVKFIFPNSNDIYLHDTPSKSLFAEDARAFSHGCVRVAKPKDLAMRVLRQYPEWTSEKIDAAMNAGRERTVTLKRKIPVYIGYFTAFVDRHGKLNFRDDVYQRDDELLSLLMKK